MHATPIGKVLWSPDHQQYIDSRELISLYEPLCSLADAKPTINNRQPCSLFDKWIARAFSSSDPHAKMQNVLELQWRTFRDSRCRGHLDLDRKWSMSSILNRMSSEFNLNGKGPTSADDDMITHRRSVSLCMWQPIRRHKIYAISKHIMYN